MVATLEDDRDGKIIFDYSRQRLTGAGLDSLFDLADSTNLSSKIASMRSGSVINTTENRSVLHHLLRHPDAATSPVPEESEKVQSVLSRVEAFTDTVRSGEHKSATGEKITDFVAIGIGGSQLGPEFVCEALRADAEASAAASGLSLTFLANVDPVDLHLTLSKLNASTTMIIVVSKTFTTAETMLNARAARSWLLSELKGKAEEKNILEQQVIAVSTALEKTGEFGIKEENVFGFWDWVGGR